jgi:nucleoside-diphosphate-sugar epimerase
MKVAIFGATSEIAKDLILSFAASSKYTLTLFARRPELVQSWLAKEGLPYLYLARHFDEFEINLEFDAIINFVGVGNPAQAAKIGSNIFEVTYQFDKMALNYLQKNPGCRYIFMSSGAAYGGSFKDPVDGESYSSFAINQLTQQDWYGLAKLHAEAIHRSSSSSIVDVRIFNYFSHTQDLEANFFITEVIRAIVNKKVFVTSSENIVRDYLGSQDFFSLIKAILEAAPFNGVIDCYSASPVDKTTILTRFKELFGLQYEIATKVVGINGTGPKARYYSINKAAGAYGYTPRFSSIDLLIQDTKKLLDLSGDY